MTVFAEKPLPEVTERLMFATDVLRGWDAEMRYQGMIGRTQVTYRLRLPVARYAALEATIAANTTADWSVPFWHERTRRVSLTSGQTVIPCDTDASYEVGALAMVWKGCDEYETATITAAGGGSITIEAGLSQDYTDAAVMPVHECIIKGPMERAKSRHDLMDFTIAFLVKGQTDIAGTPWDTYAGYPILGCSSATVTRLTGIIRPEVTYFDQQVGPVDIVRNRLTDDFIQGVEVTNHAWDVKRFLHGVRGMSELFWVQAWGGSLTVSAASAADDTVTVDRDGADLVGQHVVIDGIYREVTAAAGSVLTLDSALGADVATGAPSSVLALVRADTDEFEIAHGLVASRTVFPVITTAEAVFDGLDDGLGPSDVAFLANFEGTPGDTEYTEESQFAEAGSFGTNWSISSVNKFGATGLSHPGGSGAFGADMFPCNIAWDNARGGVTLEGFYYVNALWIVGDGGNVFSAGTGNGEVILRVLKTGDIRFRYRRASGGSYISLDRTPPASAQTYGEWHFFEVRMDFDNLTAKVYIDGSLTLDEALVEAVAPGGDAIAILNGSSNGAVTRQIQGYADSIRFTNGLTATEGTVPITRLRSTYTETRV